MGRIILNGQKFDMLTVIDTIFKKDDKGQSRKYCKCQCDCGKIVTIGASTLKNKRYHSCGCARKMRWIEKNGRDITNQRFGRLVVQEIIWEETPVKVKCVCDCGNMVILNKNDVQSGHTQSCGCLWKERISETNTKDWSNFISDTGIRFIEQDYMNDFGQWVWKCECPLCGNVFSILPAKVVNGHTTSCGCRILSSHEDYIEKLLQKMGIVYIRQYSFSDCKYKYKLKFDFAIFDDDMNILYLIEYDGQQHFVSKDFFGGEEGLKKTQERDSIKDEYCLKHNIPLIRLRFDLTNEDIKKILYNTLKP